MIQQANHIPSTQLVLVTLSPTDVGALSAQFAQLCGHVPPSVNSRGLPRCCVSANSVTPFHSIIQSGCNVSSRSALGCGRLCIYVI